MGKIEAIAILAVVGLVGYGIWRFSGFQFPDVVGDVQEGFNNVNNQLSQGLEENQDKWESFWSTLPWNQ